MGNVPLDQVGLVSIIIESLIFGISTAMFAAVLRIVLFQASFRWNSFGLALPVMSLIWILSAGHWVVDIVRIEQAFLHEPDRIAYLADISDSLEAAKIGIYVTVTLIGDCFMIYRCWVVWRKAYLVVIFPVLLWLCSGISGYGGTHALSLTKQGGIFLAELVPWITTFFSTSLATNVICTLLIAYRILQSQMAVRNTRVAQSRVMSAMIIFLESAALYSSTLIALLITYQLGSNVQFIIVDLTSPLIGITFNMILLRLVGERASSAEISTGPVHASARGEGVNVSRLVEVVRDNGYEMESFRDRVKMGDV
ncbi:unnamed protein product [Mycena citricolor]|uniref:Uncharacterized protein n=1 Tax=Mycena citricolor TaxID=2018698 RepID=A0AAD2H905_9AGAR|nr:unnamed protein product [Mycena citricolor]